MRQRSNHAACRAECVTLASVVTLLLAFTSSARADIVQTGDFDEWQSLTGVHTTLTFEDLSLDEVVTDQYADLGVVFESPFGPFGYQGAFLVFPRDGAGIDGVHEIVMRFDEGVRGFASHYPDLVQMWFYAGDELIFETGMVGAGGTQGIDEFHGVLLDQAADRVVMRGTPPNPFGDPDRIVLDNIYFSSVPGPGGVCLLALAFGVRVRRRR